MTDYIFCLQPYKCRGCARTQKQFRAGSIFIPVLLLAPHIFFLIALWLNPGLFHLQSAHPRESELARSRISQESQYSSFDQTLARKPRSTLNNAAILELSRAGVRTDVITDMIRNSIADYDIGPEAVIELLHAKVDQNVIRDMIDANYTPRYPRY